jgi:transcriptional regulator with XRE-family HTH domain
MPRSTKSRVPDRIILEVQLVKAARTLLGWSQADLATRANLSVSALKDFERGFSALIPATLAAIRQALLAGGVEIVAAEPPSVRYLSGQAPAVGDPRLATQLGRQAEASSGVPHASETKATPVKTDAGGSADPEA